MSKKTTKKDPSVATLKAEVRRLRRLVEPGGGYGRLFRHEPFRRLADQLLELADRAEPLSAQNTEVVARSRGHGGHDGIATLGDHIAIPGYAVGARADTGRFGAALAQVRRCADEVARIADPREVRGPDRAVRCGVRACSGRNIRQRSDVVFCAYCGRNLVERTPAPPQGYEPPAPKQQPPPASLNGQATAGERSEDEKATQLAADRAGLIKALAMHAGKKQ